MTQSITRSDTGQDTDAALVASVEQALAMERLHRIADPEERLAYYDKVVPEDIYNLGIANNVLLFDQLDTDVFSKVKLTEEDAKYAAPPYGTQDLLDPITAFLHPRFSAGIDPKFDVYATAGGSGALECLVFGLIHGGVLAPGDRVMLPAPFWPGFLWCFEQRPGLKCVPVRLDGPDHFTLSVAALQRAYEAASEPKPKLLVLTNPHNPLGVNYGKQLLDDICQWALDRQMHIVSDEIYSHSQSTGTDGFHSVLSTDAYATDPDRIHLVYGLTKDFGLSGFRIGFLVSKSNDVRTVMQGNETLKSLTWFGPLDSLKSAYVRKLFLTDDGKPSPFPTALMEDYAERLKTAFDQTAAELKDKKIPYVGQDDTSRNAAQFFLLDLSAYLDKTFPPDLMPINHEIDQREALLGAYLLKDAKVTLLPGGEMHCPKPGYFRLCYTADTTDRVLTAVGNIAASLAKLG
ncbi:aminotransferase class I/II-fold pyridoxal phosphate-dependent enzyme [Kitasatospora sp. NPDC091335]|uniref:aminotransferase class I/II-fold pyridoxal phosphate-dependent enzyme n=1 Tax=Kitasatospora sp. NPDC091335 TaxID=3364085 RepID=UPI0037FAD121